MRPEERKYTVVAMLDPLSGGLAYFVMVSHSFGLTSAVYNYNRRSDLLNEILIKAFRIPAAFYFDDKFGFEEEDNIVEVHATVELVHTLLGVRFDTAKHQVGTEVDILGVCYDLQGLQLRITAKRKQEIQAWIQSILKKRELCPGQAGKLKGVLQFAASQLWGKIGRAFLLVLSERQYSKSGAKDLTPPLEAALITWLWLVEFGPARPIAPDRSSLAEVVMFTDGSWPDGSSGGPASSMIGGVLFDKSQGRVVWTSMPVPQCLMEEWLPRKTQIVMIELLAPVILAQSCREQLRGRKVLLFVDSEPVEGALVKGYSNRSDMSWLTSVFWSQMLELDCLIYVDRVPTDANLADGPSRGRDAEAIQGNWEWVEPVVPKCLRKGLGWFRQQMLDLVQGRLGEKP